MGSLFSSALGLFGGGSGGSGGGGLLSGGAVAPISSSTGPVTFGNATTGSAGTPSNTAWIVGGVVVVAGVIAWLLFRKH